MATYNETVVKQRYGQVPSSDKMLASYLKAVKLIAGAGGKFSAKEQQAFGRGLDLLGVSAEVRKEVEDFDIHGAKLENVLTVNKGGVQARLLLRDAIEIASSDGNYSKVEQAAIAKAAELLGIDQRTVKSIEAYLDAEKGLRSLRDSLFR